MSDDDNVVNAFRDAQAADEAKRREIDNQKPERERKPRSLGVVDSPVSLMDAAIRDDGEDPEDDASWIDNPSEVGWRGFLNRFGFNLAPTPFCRVRRERRLTIPRLLRYFQKRVVLAKLPPLPC